MLLPSLKSSLASDGRLEQARETISVVMPLQQIDKTILVDHLQLSNRAACLII